MFQTNKYADFCAETADLSSLQEDRCRAKKWKKGFANVPSKESSDGKKVADFQRRHLYGVIGILITSGLTQLPRITHRWGTAPDLDFVWVRECMPRDLFLLFYSRFFHMAPPTGQVDKTPRATTLSIVAGTSPFIPTVLIPLPLAPEDRLPAVQLVGCVGL